MTLITLFKLLVKEHFTWEDIVQGDFVWGMLERGDSARGGGGGSSWGILYRRYCPGGYCPGKYCPDTNKYTYIHLYYESP